MELTLHVRLYIFKGEIALLSAEQSERMRRRVLFSNAGLIRFLKEKPAVQISRSTLLSSHFALPTSY
jgi:hypothetical protein